MAAKERRWGDHRQGSWETRWQLCELGQSSSLCPFPPLCEGDSDAHPSGLSAGPKEMAGVEKLCMLRSVAQKMIANFSTALGKCRAGLSSFLSHHPYITLTITRRGRYYCPHPQWVEESRALDPGTLDPVWLIATVPHRLSLRESSPCLAP